MLDIKDKPGCITKAEMRQHFEKLIADTPAFRDTTPLGIMEINGEFWHYMDSQTDTLWLGFALGMRVAERMKVSNN